MTPDTLMVHSISASCANNSAKHSHNSIQGHYHSKFEICYSADMNVLKWSMTVGCLQDPESAAARYAAGVVLKRPIIGCGVVVGNGRNHLVISDLHIPYHHPDSFEFLWSVASYYDCDTILNVGDITENHAGSYHESEPDALSAEDEYFQAKKYLQELQEMFPVMVITEGNHDQIPQRQLKSAGLPASMLRDYNTLYGLDDGWEWKDKHRFDSKKGKPVLVPMELNRRGRWDKRIQGDMMEAA